MNCVVFGGSGFIGSNLVEVLVSHGHRVTVFDRKGARDSCNSEVARKQSWVEGDFLDSQQVDAAVMGQELVFHLISTTLPSDSNMKPVFDVESNLCASIKLMQSAVRHRVRRLVFLSSGGTVYGNPLVVPIGEEHPTNPTCSYGIVKLAIEKYLALFHQLQQLPYTVVRLANPYGPYQRLGATQGAIGVFIERVLSGEPLTIWGDGELVRDYVYVRDAAEAILALAMAEQTQGVYNLGSGHGTSLNQVITTLEGVLDRSISRQYLPSRGFDVQRNFLDITQIEAAIGWRPSTTLGQGIALTVDYYRDALEKHAGGRV